MAPAQCTCSHRKGTARGQAWSCFPTGGVRGTFEQMAAMLPGYGYAVLLPDVYYRAGDWPFRYGQRVRGTRRTQQADVHDRQSDTDKVTATPLRSSITWRRAPRWPGPLRRMWLCMGGRISLMMAGVCRTAHRSGVLPRGGLVTDSADSPHLLADRMTATVYVGGAENDASLRRARRAVGPKRYGRGPEHTIDRYQAAHGSRSRTTGPTTKPRRTALDR